MTSDDLADCLRTNATVVRRTLAGLRDAGIVRSEKGHRGGWTLERNLSTIKLLEVYRAVGEPVLFQIETHEENRGCLVDAAVARTLTKARAEAEALFLQRLGNITLADLDVDIDALRAYRTNPKRNVKHAV